MPLSKFKLERHKAALIVVDMQERLAPAMDQKVYEKVRASTDLLVQGAKELGVPVLATEQYPKGLGHTVPELQSACEQKVVEKTSFGCCGEPTFMEALAELGVTEVIVTGMEAHVCVYQTVIGLLDHDFQVHLVRDGICSRNRVDFETSLDNARAAGAVVTTAETVLFQMLQHAKAPEFKAISSLVKNR